jgi:hypothetical protein
MSTRRIVLLAGRFGVVGAISGVVLGILLMVLEQVNLGEFGDIFDRLTFRLCPLYILGFGSIGWIGLIVVVLVSNALIYGAIFAAIGAVAGALMKDPDHSRVSSD